MPKSIDNSSTFEYVLESDQGKDDPPKFVFRVPTMRDEIRIGEVHDQLQQKDCSVEALRKLIEAIDCSLEKMIGMEGELIDIVNSSEALELSSAILSRGEVTNDEKKSSD